MYIHNYASIFYTFVYTPDSAVVRLMAGPLSVPATVDAESMTEYVVKGRRLSSVISRICSGSVISRVTVAPEAMIQSISINFC